MRPEQDNRGRESRKERQDVAKQGEEGRGDSPTGMVWQGTYPQVRVAVRIVRNYST